MAGGDITETDVERLTSQIAAARAEVVELEAEVAELEGAAATLREVVGVLGEGTRGDRARPYLWASVGVFLMAFWMGRSVLSWPMGLVQGGVLLAVAYMAVLGRRTYEDKSMHRRFARVTAQLAAVSARPPRARARVMLEEKLQEDRETVEAHGLPQRRDRARRQS